MGNREIIITKTIFTAERHPLNHKEDELGNVILFVSEYDKDDPDRFRSVSIDIDLDFALGNPDIITVTIQPGDTLNG